MNSSGIYSDVYDGSIWKDFQTVHTQHSEGVMYVTVLNLPHNERFLQENVIILGVIPGPKEPSKNINSFLRPFVTVLKDLWDGVIM